MIRWKLRMIGVGAALLCSGLTSLPASPAEQAEVTAQDLKQLRVPVTGER
jgi:hypothetical protein